MKNHMYCWQEKFFIVWAWLVGPSGINFSHTYSECLTLNRYTLLVGKPPFETSCLKDTYSRIKKNEYHIPSKLSTQARNLISKLLRADPGSRPSMDQIMEDEFFTSGKK